MKTPPSLLALAVLLSAVAAGANDRPAPDAPGTTASDLSQRGFEIEVPDWPLNGGNTACVRMQVTGNAFQPWRCDPSLVTVSATWLIAPGGDKRLAVLTRAPGQDWAVEHLIGIGADGRTPTSYVAQMFTLRGDRCQAVDAKKLTSIELDLYGCQVDRQSIPGGTLYHDKAGFLNAGRFKADLNWLSSAVPFWGRFNSSIDVDARSVRTFQLDQPVKRGGLRQANVTEDKPFHRYVAPVALEL